MTLGAVTVRDAGGVETLVPVLEECRVERLIPLYVPLTLMERLPEGDQPELLPAYISFHVFLPPLATLA